MYRIFGEVLGIQDWWDIITSVITTLLFKLFFPAKAGSQVIIPYRDEDEKRHLKVMGDLGQIVPLVGWKYMYMEPVFWVLTGLGMGHAAWRSNRWMLETLWYCVQPRRPRLWDEVRFSFIIKTPIHSFLNGSEFRNFDYHSVHAKGAETIARIAAENNVPRFVQVSHLNASRQSPSKFYQTKAEGEELVQAVFPNATIVRPAAMFGYEDKLLNNVNSTWF